jgi:hypothetical protein
MLFLDRKSMLTEFYFWTRHLVFLKFSRFFETAKDMLFSHRLRLKTKESTFKSPSLGEGQDAGLHGTMNMP